MKCEECEILIEESIDAALDPKGSARLSEHLSACRACSKFYEQLSREQEIYARYRRDVEVTPALWAAVQARIEAEKGARPMSLAARLRQLLGGMVVAPRLSPAFAAAMVIAAIAITAGVMSYLNSRERSSGGQISQNQQEGAQGQKPAEPPAKTDGKDQPPISPATKPGQGGEVAKSEEKGLRKPQRAAEKPGGALAQARRPVTPAEPTPQQLVREAEQKYVAAIAILQRDFNQRRSQLDPEMRARFDNALADIDKTIAETRRVVRQNPDDPIALQYLLAAYSKKVDALREMSRE